MDHKPILRIAVEDYGARHIIDPFLLFFSLDYTIIEDYENPDILVYSCSGESHFNYQCKRLFVCTESITPDFNFCDYYIGTVKLQYDERSLWIPEAFYKTVFPDNKSIEIKDSLFDRKFCSFIYSHDCIGYGARYRREFCERLMKEYKHVDCPGKILHNMDSPLLSPRNNENNWHQSKLDFLRNYKFNIAFENTQAPGYITEKLVDCYMANTVPIYWGSSGDVWPYPKESMICANDFSSMNALIDRVKEVDTNNELYAQILKANPFREENRQILPNFEMKIRKFIRFLLQDDLQLRRTPWGMTDAHRCMTYYKKGERLSSKVVRYLKRLIPKKRD